MVPFAGYEMPLQYPAGVMTEHLATRAKAGLFDVSHMGQIALSAKSGDVADAARALERLIPADILGLSSGRQRYAFFTSETGGILDDLMIARFPERFLIVCNASRKAFDEAHLRAHLSDCCHIEVMERALIALQGPGAQAALAKFAPGVSSMRFMDAREIAIMGAQCFVTRSGYTGEDGFELSAPSQFARAIAEALLFENVAPIGLGARDSLRLEAGLCLYGSDIDETTTPVEASLSWAIQKVRRRGGARAGGFPGAGVILHELDNGARRRRVGLRIEGRAPVRAGALIHAADDDNGPPVGRVTSGCFGPSVDAPIAIGYLSAQLATPGARVFAELRGKRLPATVAALPFIETRYKQL